MATVSLAFVIYSISIMLCTGHEKFIGTYDEINFNLESWENMVWINEESLITRYYYVSPEEKIIFFFFHQNKAFTSKGFVKSDIPLWPFFIN